MADNIDSTDKSRITETSRCGIGGVRGHLIFWPIFIVGLIVDLWSKSAVFEWLSNRPLRTCDVIDGFFRLVVVQNAGAAWGMASGQRVFLVAISVAALIGVFAVFLFWKRPGGLVVTALAMFAAGVCGNLYDRIYNYGRVRDFLDFYWGDWHFPAFNVADSLLTISVAILMIVTVLSPPKVKKQ